MTTDKKLNLVLEGGGVKGIALVSAIEELENAGYSWACLGGTSAGAIVATLLAVGYTGSDLKDKLLNDLDFRNIMDSNWPNIQYIRSAKGLDKVLIIPLIWNLLRNFFKNYGLFDGDYILNYVRNLIKIKTGEDRYTFSHLARRPDATITKLNLMVTDITNKRLLILPRDLKKLNIKAKDMEIALAMRMSMSFPLFFKPIRICVKNKDLWFMDGGVLSNFPYWYVDGLETHEGKPAYPTVGLELIEKPDEPIASIWGLVTAMLSTMISSFDRAYASSKKRVIKIDVKGISTLDFDLSSDKKDYLCNNGKSAAIKFLKQFNYQEERGVSFAESLSNSTFNGNPKLEDF